MVVFNQESASEQYNLVGNECGFIHCLSNEYTVQVVLLSLHEAYFDLLISNLGLGQPVYVVLTCGAV